MSDQEDNAHVLEAFDPHGERRLAMLRSLGLIDPEPTEPGGFDGGARESANQSLDPMADHNAAMVELIDRAKFNESQAMDEED